METQPQGAKPIEITEATLQEPQSKQPTPVETGAPVLKEPLAVKIDELNAAYLELQHRYAVEVPSLREAELFTRRLVEQANDEILKLRKDLVNHKHAKGSNDAMLPMNAETKGKKDV